MVSLITHDYDEQQHAIQQIFNTEGIVLLQEFLLSPKKVRKEIQKLPSTKLFHPLRHRWTVCTDMQLRPMLNDVREYLKMITGETLDPTAYILEKGDYSILSDDIQEEHGIVAFMEISNKWDDKWGGKLGLENEMVHLPKNSLLLVSTHRHRWFIKYINHLAKDDKVIVVFRERKKK